MSSQRHSHRRSKLGSSEASHPATATSSIRGKISGPILIEDDDFPIKTPGTSVVASLPSDAYDKHTNIPTSSNASAILRHDTSANADPTRLTAHGRADHHESIAEDASVASAAGTPQHARQSVITTEPEAPPQAGDTRSQRKRTLKSVLGRLFGRKKRDSASSAPNQSILGGAAHRESDPSALMIKTKNQGQRSVSLPINEYNRALRSHSALLGEPPIEEGENKENIAPRSGDWRSDSHHLFAPIRISTSGFDEWTGLSPRPASSHARSSRFLGDPLFKDTIGAALTSGSHPNRRSRSLGQLRESTRIGSTNRRRRSEEIRYWRMSNDGILRSVMPPAETEADECPSSPEQLVQSRSFDFGPLGDLEDGEITQAIHLETRISQLEARMHRLEEALSRILGVPSASWSTVEALRAPATDMDQSQAWTDTAPVRKPSRSGSALGRTLQHPGSAGHDRQRGRDLRDNNNLSPVNPLKGGHNLDFAMDQGLRPASTATTTTVRARVKTHELPETPALPQDGRLTMEHYRVLSTIMSEEQKARKGLALVVATLQKDMEALRAKTFSRSSRASSHDEEVQYVSAFDRDSSDDGSALDALTEDFKTPNEEQTFDDKAFGDEIDGSHLDKHMARTLSLSQLTMGGQQGGLPPRWSQCLALTITRSPS